MVSIIIPLFNQEEFVATAIQSALSQTYKDFEVIVVNDGSTDGSEEVARRYPVKLVTQSNRGLAGARNSGIMNALGDLILPLDADDRIDPEYLSKTVPLMQDGVGIVSTDMRYFGDKTGTIVARKVTALDELLANSIPVCSLIRKQAVLDCGGYSHKVWAYEDWNLWIDILKRGWEIAVVNEPLFHYRVHQSMCSAASKQHDVLHSQIKDIHRDVFTTTTL